MSAEKRILVTGATGLLGPWVMAEVERVGHTPIGWGGASAGIDLTDREATHRRIDDAAPEAIIHCAAMSAIADCARDPARARKINVDAATNLARTGRRMVQVSTDLVFDGESPPYRESAMPAPLSVYGLTKWQAERAVQESSRALVVRVSLLFGPSKSGRRGFFEAFAASSELALFDDEWRTPLSLLAAAESLVALAVSSASGLLHLGGPERISRLAMGERLKKLTRSPVKLVGASREDVVGEPRPRDVSLDSTEFHRLFPALALSSFEEECTRMTC